MNEVSPLRLFVEELRYKDIHFNRASKTLLIKSSSHRYYGSDKCVHLLKTNQMNFTDFTTEISVEFGISRELARRILTTILKKMKKRLIFGDNIKLTYIGTLKLRIRQPKKFLHLKTGKMELSKKSYFLDIKPTPSMNNTLKQKPLY